LPGNGNDFFLGPDENVGGAAARFSFLRDDVADDELSRRSQNEERDLTGSYAR